MMIFGTLSRDCPTSELITAIDALGACAYTVGTEGAFRSAVLAGTDGHSDAVDCAGHCATSGHHRPGRHCCAVGGGALQPASVCVHGQRKRSGGKRLIGILRNSSLLTYPSLHPWPSFL